MDNKLRIRLGSLILTLLAYTGVAMAQQSGTILGVVKDSSGSIVPGAKVTITNTDTNAVRTVVTEDDGSYRVNALPPAHYSLQIEKEGFKKQSQTGLQLDVGQELVVNASLEVGSAAEVVTVNGAQDELVNTTTSDVGSLVNDQDISDLPLNGRNFVDLAVIQPGVTSNWLAGGGAGGLTGTFYSANGSSIRSNFFSLDGAIMLNAFGGGPSSQAGTTLGVDGIREYNVVTHTFGAEYGMRMGSQAIMVSKGGTNNWHGDAFEYLRNSVMDARNFFDAPPSVIGKRLPEFQRNNFGGSFGGPIQKDKTFFYAVYEGLRERLGVTETASVLPAACHNLVPIGNGGTNVGEVTVTAVQTAPFPGGANLADPAACATGLTNTTVIPATIQPTLGQYPIVAANANGQNLFPGSGQSGAREDYGQIRVDHNFSTTDMMFVRYTIDDTDLHTPTTSAVLLNSAAAYPQWGTLAGSRNQYLTIGYTHVFSPAVLNQASISWSRTNLHTQNNYLTTFLNPFGPLIGPSFSLANDSGGVPLVQGTWGVSGLTTLGGSNTSPDYHIINIGTFKDDYSINRGKHALKFGALLNRFGQGEDTDFIQNGSITFSSIANMMQGLPSTYRVMTALPGSGFANPVFPRYYIYSTIGVYAQDDYRVRQHLTLNLGLRYEINTDIKELNGLESYIPDILTSNTYAHGAIFNNYSLRNWSPRLGFAWDIFGDGKTSLRGAWGIYYDVASISATVQNEPLGMPPYGVQNQVQANSQVPMTLPLTLNNYSVVGTSGLTLQGIDHDIQQPYSNQFTLMVDRQLPFDTLLSVGYVNSRGYHIWNIQEGNPCTPTSITNGVYSWLTDPTNPGSSKANPTCPLGRTNPSWNSAVWYTSNSSSWYNGMQVVATKNLSHGLQGQFSYTWSHSIDDTQGQQRSADCTGSGNTFPINSDNISYSRGPSCFDIRNSFRINLLYHLPQLNGSKEWVRKVTNGWWVGSIMTIQGGVPFSPVITGNRSLDGGLGGQIGEFPNLVTATTAGTGKAAGVNFVPYNASTVITGNPNNWFNPLMFELGPIGSFGSVPRGFLRGPNEREIDMSINKDTHLGILGETGKLEFRAEIFNVFNHPNFGLPNGTVFSGNQADTAPTSELPTGGSTAHPFGTAGQILTTITTSRQIQLALKIIF